MEGEDEIRGLRFWDGDPTVRLLAADDQLGAMLLERCEPGTPLSVLPEPEQDVVLTGLLPRGSGGGRLLPMFSPSLGYERVLEQRDIG